MKYMKKIVALVLAMALVLGLAACSKGAGGETTNAPEIKTEGQEPSNSGDAADKPAAGQSLLFYTAGIGDFGIGDMGHRAGQAAADLYGYDYTLVEYGQDSSLAINSLVDALDTKHYDVVLAASWYISDTVVEKSQPGGEWEDIKFILYDCAASMDVGEATNIYGIAFAQNEGSFLAGVYSALMTKTGKIGCVINLDMPITNDFGTGWLCGYKYAVKELGLDVDMMYTYMGELTVQGDYESVNVLADNGCDIIYNVGASVSMGALQAADEKGGIEKGVFIIGTDYDQYEYFVNVGQVQGYETMVTSMLKNIEHCCSLLFADFNGEHKIQPGAETYGIAEGGTGLVVNEHFKELTPQDVQDKIAEISDKVANGEIEVLSYFDFPTYEDFATYRDNPEAEFTK